MGIYDRDYARDSYQGGGRMRIGVGFGGLGPIVKWLLIINFVVFLLTISPVLKKYLFVGGAIYPENYLWMMQIWRLITYQFLHLHAQHFLFNMVFLYFFGPFLEHYWGSRHFLKFYLSCGAVGGILYQLLVLMNVMESWESC